MNTQQIEEKKRQILEQLNAKGPLLGLEVARAVALDSVMAGALLSELLKAAKVKVSSAKIGSSPVYYLPGSEAKLERLYPYLNEKDRRAYDELVKSKVLREEDLTPLLRVSVQSLHDFAVPLDVKIGNDHKRFWKWHLATNEEVTSLIRSMYAAPKSAPAAENTPKKTQPSVPKAVTAPAAQPYSKEKKEEEAKEETKKQEAPEKELKKAVEKAEKDTVVPKKVVEKELKEKKPVLPEQTTLEQPLQEIRDAFHTEVMAYFREKKITVISQTLLKKGREMEYVIKVPSSLGSMGYYCMAKNRKSFNEGDISSAYVRGMKRKLPTLFLTTGKASKKAMEKLKADFPDVLIRSLKEEWE